MNWLVVLTLTVAAAVWCPFAAQAEIRSVTVGKSKISANVARATRSAGLSEEEQIEAIRKARPPNASLQSDDGQKQSR
jgi:hypothetical protein